MSPVWKVAAFFAQSAAVGLAIAFLVVLFRPDLVSTGRPALEPRRRELRGRGRRQRASRRDDLYAAHLTRRRTRRRGVALRGRALGSGVVIDRDGYVVTNWHVIRDADEIRVQLADGRVATPRIVGTDPRPSSRCSGSTARLARRSRSAAPTARRSARSCSRSAIRSASARRSRWASCRAKGRGTRDRGVRGLHPDRRGDQPGQLGRRARQPQAASSSASTRPRSRRAARLAMPRASASRSRRTWRGRSWSS